MNMKEIWQEQLEKAFYRTQNLKIKLMQDIKELKNKIFPLGATSKSERGDMEKKLKKWSKKKIMKKTALDLKVEWWIKQVMDDQKKQIKRQGIKIAGVPVFLIKCKRFSFIS